MNNGLSIETLGIAIDWGFFGQYAYDAHFSVNLPLFTNMTKIEAFSLQWPFYEVLCFGEKGNGREGHFWPFIT